MLKNVFVSFKAIFVSLVFFSFLFESPLFAAAKECDLIVFSHNRPMQLYACLESVAKHVEKVRQVTVVYEADTEFADGYEIVKTSFPNVFYHALTKESSPGDLKTFMMQRLYGPTGLGADYILFAVDGIIVTDKINLAADIDKLEKASAYGFYYRLGKHVDYCYPLDLEQGVPELKDIDDGYFTWRFKSGDGDWKCSNSFDFVLYRKKHIFKKFKKIEFNFPGNIEEEWAARNSRSKKGICFERAKVINIPMNIVPKGTDQYFLYSYTAEELNEIFLSGHKIDIDQYFQILNSSARDDIFPEFIAR